MNNLANTQDTCLKKFDKEIKQLFLKFASETEENIACMNNIEFSRLGKNWGIKLKNKDIFISDIINALEDIEDTPDEVKEYFSDVNQEEWQSSTRLSTLILILFEKILEKQWIQKVRKQIEIASNNEMLTSNRHDFNNKIKKNYAV